MADEVVMGNVLHTCSELELWVRHHICVCSSMTSVSPLLAMESDMVNKSLTFLLDKHIIGGYEY